jgi:tRNA-dihydrouridine synthase 1
MEKLQINEPKKIAQTASTDKLTGYEFYKSLGSPKFICAPMVEQSDLPFRMLTRKYGCDLAYTPMYHSRVAVEDKKYLNRNFFTCPEDRPLIVQFCGNDPEIITQASLKVQDRCDAVDINLGCPQGIARKGRYGSFLLESQDIIL